MKILYKDIAKAVNKSESAIKQWKKNNPDLLRLVKIGLHCEKSNITIDMINNCIELKELSNQQNKEK